MPLRCTGVVPFRPLGKSHYLHAPWDEVSSDTKYQPSDMSILALKNSIAKYPSEIINYSDEELQVGFDFLYQELLPIWTNSKIWSFEHAISDCDLSKGSGHPFHYVAPTKEEALDKFADVIKDQVDRVLIGDEEVDMPCSMTLKDELRSEERVKAHKTRAFNASNFVHLLASKMLFGDQNERLHANRNQIPITLGITVPGPEYVDAVLSMGNKAGDGDGDGFDLRFKLQLARVIRDLRKAFLPKEYWAGIDLLYDAIYCGETITMGHVYRLLCQKSGWANTGDDNSLMLWLAIFLAFRRMGLEDEFRKKLIPLLVNGDDHLLGNKSEKYWDMKMLADTLLQSGVHISFDRSDLRSPFEVTYLSHHLRERRVEGFGDVIVAAGNRAKLLSSLNWVKPNSSLSFEESCLAHLLGIRLCLWPWKHEFDMVEEIIDSFLQSKVLTPLMKQLLCARLPEERVLLMHIGFEREFVFSTFTSDEVDQVTLSLIKKYTIVNTC